MQNHEGSILSAPKHTPWNKGKLIGAKPPLWPKHVWSIRTKLQIEGRIRDLALFNLAIDSKLRGCDVVTHSGSKTLLLMDMQSPVRRCAKKRPGARSGSN